MGTLAAFLGSIAWPVVSRVLLAMGFGIVSYAGVAVALNAAISQAQSAFGGVGADLMDFLAMGGIFEAFSVIAGGLVASVAFGAVNKIALRSAGA